MWKRIDGKGDLPKKVCWFVPVAVETSRGTVPYTAAWAENSEGDVIWYGVDGKRILARILAWYEVPQYAEEQKDG